jgi:hypothetical protein
MCALFLARMQAGVRWCLGGRKTAVCPGPDCPLPRVTSLPRYGDIVGGGGSLSSPITNIARVLRTVAGYIGGVRFACVVFGLSL